MFLFAFIGQYFAMIKTVAFGLLALIVSLLGLNYIRRGRQIDEQKRQIEGLKVKSRIDDKNTKVDEGLVKKETSIDNEKPDELLDDVNHMHK